MGNPWTDEEKRIVAEMYPDHFATEISEKIGRPLSGIYRMAQLLGLKSSPENILVGMGVTGAEEVKMIS